MSSNAQRRPSGLRGCVCRSPLPHTHRQRRSAAGQAEKKATTAGDAGHRGSPRSGKGGAKRVAEIYCTYQRRLTTSNTLSRTTRPSLVGCVHVDLHRCRKGTGEQLEIEEGTEKRDRQRRRACRIRRRHDALLPNTHIGTGRDREAAPLRPRKLRLLSPLLHHHRKHEDSNTYPADSTKRAQAREERREQPPMASCQEATRPPPAAASHSLNPIPSLASP